MSSRCFVVVRDTEEYGRQMAVFSDLSDATGVYEEAAYVIRNAPGEGATDEPTVVTAAALFMAETGGHQLAKVLVANNQASLIEAEDWPGWDDSPSRT